MQSTSNNNLQKNKHGFTIMEIMVSLAIITVAMSIFGPMMMESANIRRQQVARAHAVEAVRNILEEVAHAPDTLKAGELDSKPYMQMLPASLKEPDLKITVTEETEPFKHQRIHVSLNWILKANQRVQPVTLFSMKFTPEKPAFDVSGEKQ